MDINLIYPLDCEWTVIARALENIGICFSKSRNEGSLVLFNETVHVVHVQYVDTTVIRHNALSHDIGVLFFFLGTNRAIGEAVLTRNLAILTLSPSKMFVVAHANRHLRYPLTRHTNKLTIANFAPLYLFSLPDDAATLRCMVASEVELILGRKPMPGVLGTFPTHLFICDWIRRFETTMPQNTVSRIKDFGKAIGTGMANHLRTRTPEPWIASPRAQLKTLHGLVCGILHRGSSNNSMLLGHCVLAERHLKVNIYTTARPTTFQILLGHFLTSLCWAFLGCDDSIVCSQDETHLTIYASVPQVPD